MLSITSIRADTISNWLAMLSVAAARLSWLSTIETIVAADTRDVVGSGRVILLVGPGDLAAVVTRAPLGLDVGDDGLPLGLVVGVDGPALGLVIGVDGPPRAPDLAADDPPRGLVVSRARGRRGAILYCES